MRTLALAAIALALGAGSASAQKMTWVVTETGQASSQGEWQVTVSGSVVTGRGSMTAEGRQVSFGITGERRGDEMHLKRTESSDGQPCAYRGRVGADGRIVGTALCGRSNGRWVVVRK